VHTLPLPAKADAQPGGPDDLRSPIHAAKATPGSTPRAPVPTENSVPINQHPCDTLIADLVDALSLLASISESKGRQSLPRPVVECIQVQGVRFAKESDFDQQEFGWVDQGKAAFPLRKATSMQTGLLRLSSEALVV
jgi:hypothetical protein